MSGMFFWDTLYNTDLDPTTNPNPNPTMDKAAKRKGTE